MVHTIRTSAVTFARIGVGRERIYFSKYLSTLLHVYQQMRLLLCFMCSFFLQFATIQSFSYSHYTKTKYKDDTVFQRVLCLCIYGNIKQVLLYKTLVRVPLTFIEYTSISANDLLIQWRSEE